MVFLFNWNIQTIKICLLESTCKETML